MSNDLISRSEVIELIESKCTDGCFGNEDITLIDAYNLLDDVSELPTAYDVDKVVEQLETKTLGRVCVGCGYLADNVCTYKGPNCGVSKMYEDIKKVFEEVKAGGVNEDD